MPEQRAPTYLYEAITLVKTARIELELARDTFESHGREVTAANIDEALTYIDVVLETHDPHDPDA